jgi:extracellular factor (EF) 3-hydroxypalmitic acid methyl ester biosynthesis protein
VTPEVNGLRVQCAGFVQESQRLFQVAPEYKVVIADFHTFLSDVRLWLDKLELTVRSSPSGSRLDLERTIIDEISEPIVRSIDVFVDRFELIVARLDSAEHPAYRAYLRRQLHPLLLASPFAYRTFSKPLGYAGDYEVVNMMLRPPHEGSTLFAKTMNVWLLGQAPVQGHRNRINVLMRTLHEVTARARANQRTARILSLGCGPAAEVQQFIRESSLAEYAEFTLLDFNEETLQFLRGSLDEVKRSSSRGTPIQLVKKSVHQLLKEAARASARPAETQYDLIYCAGLFDYLSDQVCKRLMNLSYDMLAPGGLLVATNVSAALNPIRPFRHSMEYILDWHLVYRDGNRVAALAPDYAPADDVSVTMEESGCNLFISVHKPNHA